MDRKEAVHEAPPRKHAAAGSTPKSATGPSHVIVAVAISTLVIVLCIVTATIATIVALKQSYVNDYGIPKGRKSHFECKEGYTGTFCESELSECELNSCTNKGSSNTEYYTESYCDTIPTDEKIRSVTQQLWMLDRNRARKTEVKYNMASEDRLFTFVDENLMGRNTYKSFNKLRTMYDPVIGIADCTDPECKDSENKFLDDVIASDAMEITQKFLVYYGCVKDKQPASFRDFLWDTWFRPYNRLTHSEVLDSRGFEHVFLGEIRNGIGVTGFHNWVQFYGEEATGNLKYNRGHSSTCQNPLANLHLEWRGYSKSPSSSMWIRTSPEFEMAIYTICFMARPGERGGHSLGICKTQFSGAATTIKTRDMRYIIPRTIGAAYPVCNN